VNRRAEGEKAAAEALLEKERHEAQTHATELQRQIDE
jgi:hypothetical protein